jgi:prepilin-type N-terminal cleavage/methylation domain-containing protein
MREKKFIGGNAGMTLVEVLVAITIFATGVLSLTRVMFQVMQANVRSKHVVVATNLAHQRMEQILSSTRYNNITTATFPSEGYGAVNGGSPECSAFSRTVAIADSVDALGASVMKDVTIRVQWRERGRTRTTEIHSSISRFKDIKL